MHFADYKTILSPQNGMNLFRGCSHGCIYCDSRSRCYQINHDFEDIEIKRGAARILEGQLLTRRRKGMVSTGAMCDPYMPFEQTLEVTRQCLQVIHRHGFGLAVQTKSALILRDLGLLKAINVRARCVAEMTLTTYDDALCKVIEPNVSPTSERVRALETLRDSGIPTVVWLSPILPFINDTEDNLLGLLDSIVRAGVKAVLFFGFGVTLREGNREYFYAKLDAHFPGMKQRYIKTFGNAYQCISPNNARLTEILKRECRRHGILLGSDKVFEFIRRFDVEEEDRQVSWF